MLLIITTLMIMTMNTVNFMRRLIQIPDTLYLTCSFVTATRRVRTRTGLLTSSMWRMTCISMMTTVTRTSMAW